MTVRTRMATAVGLLVVCCLLTSCSGCIPFGSSVEIGELKTEKTALVLGNAQRVEVSMDVGTGKFRIRGGAEGLLDAEFTYNVEEWTPIVDYEEKGGRGTLKIKQPGTGSKRVPNGAHNEWDIALNNDVVTSLELDVGVGNVEMDVTGLSLTYLEIDQGVGNTVLDLTGDWDQDLTVMIDGGVGESRLRLPSKVGVRVRCDTGVGSVKAEGLEKRRDVYVNDAYDESDVTIDVDIDAGVGAIYLEVAGARGVRA
jgi:hypothetical protein